MAADMVYNGTTVKFGDKTYKATSGLTGTQKAKFQNQKDHGPIPEGTYRLLAKDVGVTKSSGGELLTGRPGIETLPPNPLLLEQWGPDRVFLEILKIDRPDCRKRNGFYLHDSTKGFTHGCIEIEARLFTDLRNLALKKPGTNVLLVLKVAYPSPEGSTNGGTSK